MNEEVHYRKVARGWFASRDEYPAYAAQGETQEAALARLDRVIALHRIALARSAALREESQ